MKLYALKSKEADQEVIYKALLDFVKSTKKDWNYITPEDLEKKGTDKFYILDIRDKEAFKECHIKGAKNIFWMDLLNEENLKKLPKNKKILLVLCRSYGKSDVSGFSASWI